MTVCNQNRVHCERLATKLENCTLEEQDTPRPACERLRIIQPYACSDQKNEDHTEERHEEVPDIVRRQERFIFYYMNIAESVRLSVGHHFIDMIKFCTFKGRKCLKER